MINLKKTKAYSDGTADYQFDYSKEFEAYYKQVTGAKRVTKANVGKFIQKLLMESVNEPTPKKR